MLYLLFNIDIRKQMWCCLFLSAVKRLLFLDFLVAAGKWNRSKGIKQEKEMKTLHLSFNLGLKRLGERARVGEKENVAAT